MVRATPAEIEELLARHGIRPLVTGGTHSKAAAQGGRLASIRVVRQGNAGEIVLSMRGLQAHGVPPLDAGGAHEIVTPFLDAGALPNDPRQVHMLEHLLVNASAMFVDSQAETLTFESIRLHETAYHIGSVVLLRNAPGHLKPRLAPDSHDRHAVFAHRHGDNPDFPK